MAVPLYTYYSHFSKRERFSSLSTLPFFAKNQCRKQADRIDWLVYFYATVELVHSTHYVDKAVLMAGVANTYMYSTYMYYIFLRILLSVKYMHYTCSMNTYLYYMYCILNQKIKTLKRLPLFNFPTLWNSAGNEKNNPRQHVYLKLLKSRLLMNLRWITPPLPPSPSPHPPARPLASPAVCYVQTPVALL